MKFVAGGGKGFAEVMLAASTAWRDEMHDMIDRLRPTERPAAAARGYQRWRSLLFMHWPVPLAVLRSLVPAALELDTYAGSAYVGIVPFAMEGVRPRWSPEQLAFHFLETNVRTYVYFNGQPGVYFFSLDAASGLAVWAARHIWGLPYYRADMQMSRDAGEICYDLRRRGTNVQHRVRYRLGELLGASHPDTLEFFFLERYLMFIERRQQLWVGQVHHAPYPAQLAEVLSVEDGLMEAAGLGRCEELPAFVHYASGVDVEIFDLRPVTRQPPS